MKYFSVLIFCTVSFSLSAQTYSVSPFVDYTTLTVSTKAYIGTKYLIYSSPSNFDGFRVGLATKRTKEKRFWNLEMAYFQSQSAITFVNLTPDEDPKLGIVWYSLEQIYANRRIDFSLNRGLSLGRKFFLEFGILGCYWFKDELAGEPDSYFEQFESRRRTKILYRYADSYENLSLSYKLKLSYEFGPLNVYLAGEKSITPITKNLNFGVTYPIKQNYTLYTLGLSYLLFKREHT
ncbi:MAG: hypothetical protein KF775_14460 [Cyclobacteriaceae bacterium]|nr:hypothetical protein [Cyclobacteriaceae bacterium]